MIKMYLALSFVTVSLLFSILGQAGFPRGEGAEMKKAPVEKNDSLEAGVWGGQHIRMKVTDSGAELEYDCARSTIDQPIELDCQGRFEVKGRFIKEHGAPVSRDNAPNSSPVRYAGQVEGDKMKLTIRHEETGENFGDYNLTRGSEGQLMKCM